MGDFVCCSDVTRRRELYAPEEVSFPISFRYVDVTRQTCIDLEHAAEIPMNNYLNMTGIHTL